MAMILNKLPREPRDQIYRELLLDVQGIKIAHNCISSDFIVPKQLFPAILRVCQQVFSEASMILYEENIFYYNDSIYRCSSCVNNLDTLGTSWSCLFPLPRGQIGHFQRVKHLKFSYFAFHPHYAKGPVNLDKTLLLMGLIAKTGCSLKSLCLSWTLQDCDYSLYELEAGSLIIGGDERIAHAIAGLNMPQKIEIIVDSDDVGHYHRCEAFTTKIGSLLQWSTMNVTKKCIKISMEVGSGVEEVHAYEEVENLVDWSEQKNSSDETSGDSDTEDASVDSNIARMENLCNDIGICYVWTWTLAPTPT